MTFTKGLAPRWGFTQRTIGGIGHLFAPLEKVIKDEFIPSLTDRTLNIIERQIMELPVRMGGLGIQNPEKNSHREFENSKYITEKLVEHLLQQNIDYYPEQDEITTVMMCYKTRIMRMKKKTVPKKKKKTREEKQ